MDSGMECVGWPVGPESSELLRLGADAMVTEMVVEQVVQARARGEARRGGGRRGPGVRPRPENGADVDAA